MTDEKTAGDRVMKTLGGIGYLGAAALMGALSLGNFTFGAREVAGEGLKDVRLCWDEASKRFRDAFGD